VGRRATGGPFPVWSTCTREHHPPPLAQARPRLPRRHRAPVRHHPGRRLRRLPGHRRRHPRPRGRRPRLQPHLRPLRRVPRRAAVHRLPRGRLHRRRAGLRNPPRVPPGHRRGTRAGRVDGARAAPHRAGPARAGQRGRRRRRLPRPPVRRRRGNRGAVLRLPPPRARPAAAHRCRGHHPRTAYSPNCCPRARRS